jgi:hypothetical protein
MPFPVRRLQRDYIFNYDNLGINLDYDLGEVPDHAAPPVIALDAGNSSSSASTFASDRVPWKYESYERLATEEIGAKGARIPILFVSSTLPRLEAGMWSIY